jgi:hypothetical protein
MYGVGKIPGDEAWSTVPQLRQNRIDGGFSVRHAGQVTSNPPGGPGVEFASGAGPTNEVPQLRQKPAPGGLS